MKTTRDKFGTFNGETIYKYSLENDNGMKLSCLNLGCIVTDILVPDREGKFENVVLSFNNVDDYIRYQTYFGAIIGRVAGRIKNSEFELNKKKYLLSANEGKHHLHGGTDGFHEKIWNASTFQTDQEVGVEFTYTSKDGEGGYPGNVHIQVTYTLTNDNRWKVRINGTTDETTLLNMTNHTYFNLSGNGKTDILNHQLTMKSDRFLELDEDLLPTGKIMDVEGTVFDFRHGRKIRDGILSPHPQNTIVGNGYDHPFILSEKKEAIILKEGTNGRKLVIETNQPSVILYSGNSLKEDYAIKEGVPVRKYLGLCLETQGFPDAIHHPHFPSIILEPNQRYMAETTYTFGVE
ncbi:aldose epimerase family protein [Fervidibacillus halotolerans]|uniref:Aldose 1-epimerase n=1 Tax=Fervidibacillus halotolerans TaxID=2980027 RepID=A0A9E8LZF9_9BACI|nr:aldose epimerase family protein [Fervidibacillus halotolerans]WAA12535.1 galactose mutarotase [Fervidibacillus halotolerans]